MDESDEAHPPSAERSPAPESSSEPSPTSQQNQPDPEKRPSSGDRKKWEPAELPVLTVAQQTLEETCAVMIGELNLCRVLKALMPLMTYTCFRLMLRKLVLFTPELFHQLPQSLQKMARLSLETGRSGRQEFH